MRRRSGGLKISEERIRGGKVSLNSLILMMKIERHTIKTVSDMSEFEEDNVFEIENNKIISNVDVG